jgi:hypothetical protein
MTNNNKSFYTILSLSKPRLMKDSSYNIIASSHYLGTFSSPFQIDSPILAKRLNMVFDSSLKIVGVSNEFTKDSYERIGDSISNDFMFFKITSESFFTTNNIQNILIENKNIHQCIFIFKDRDYGDIARNLSLFNIIVSGGSNTKKHILSPIQLRLARFLIAFLPLTGSDVVNSFHSYRVGQKVGYDMTTKEVKKEIEEFIRIKDNENGK